MYFLLKQVRINTFIIKWVFYIYYTGIKPYFAGITLNYYRIIDVFRHNKNTLTVD